MPLLDEAELIGRAQQGDVDAFCSLVSGYQRPMYALAFRLSGNHHDAEDLAQELFIRAYRAVGQFKGQSSFHTWLRRILLNLFIDRQRRNEPRSQEQVTEGSFHSIPGSERVAFNNVIVQEILQHLEGFPARQRAMFIMKHQEGLTCEEIAGHFGTTVGTVKKTLFRVVEELRWHFRPKDKVVRGANDARLSETS